jgi:fructokinase
MIIGAIEAGGTKFVCGLFEADGSEYGKPALISRTTIPTTTPAATLAAARDFFMSSKKGNPDSIGIGCFGPVDLKPSSKTWGYITSTPKPGWKNTDIAGFFRSELGLAVAFDTDVNAAAFGEFLWGAAKGLKDFVYITVGTGIGGGVFSSGSLVHGLVHPELGHIKIARDKTDDFPGCCPFHRDCLEGMASGPAIALRWNSPADKLSPRHQGWELESRYLSRAFAAYTFVLSPERIILGGGIGLRPGLAEKVATLLGEELAGYVAPLVDSERLAEFVKRPMLGADAGLYGSAALGLRISAG